MGKALTHLELIERSLIKRFRKELWTPLIAGVKRYGLLQAGDRVAVAFSGTMEELLLCKLLQELQRHGSVPFEPVFFLSPQARMEAEALAQTLGIPLSPAQAAQECPKEARPTRMNDVLEYTLSGLLHRGELTGLMPYQLEQGRMVICPLYCISREDARSWVHYNALEPLPGLEKPPELRRAEALIAELKPDTPDVEKNLFNSLHNVWQGTYPHHPDA